MQFFIDVFHQLFGAEATGANVFASFVKFWLGAALVMWWETSKRDVASDRTPPDYKWWFFLKDNIGRFFSTTIWGVIVVIMGANVTYLIGIEHVPESLGQFIPIFAGLFSDVIAVRIKWWRKKISNSQSNTPENANTQPPQTNDPTGS